VKTRRKPNAGKRSDTRSEAALAEAGWDLTRIRAEDHGRFVARKRIIEDDHSVTLRFESSYTLEDLAKNVSRRERETA
jgi:hypothetical protein